MQSLATAKDWGLTQIEAIATEEAERIGASVRQCRHYLSDVMDYDLGEEHLQALETFGAKARAHGLLPTAPDPIRVADTGK